MPEAERGPKGSVMGVAVGVLVLLLAALATVLVIRDRNRQPGAAEPILTTSPLPATPAQTPTGGVTQTPPAAGPTARQAMAFAMAYRPPGASGTPQFVVVDADGDGIDDVVIATVVQGSVRVDVAAWNGSDYAVVFTGRGGSADQVNTPIVADQNGDGKTEIVTQQAVGAQGASLSIWGWDGVAYAAQSAVDGCWDGMHTYGVVGAQITSAGIKASCDDSPLPIPAWTSDLYEWDGSAWTYTRTQGPDF